MKHILTGLLTLLFSILSLHLSSQAVGIRADNSLPDASSMLDIKSNTKGLLIPRMTSTQRIAIVVPAVGLMVYDTDTQSFWYRNTTGWVNSMASPVKALAYIYNTNPQLCFIEADLTFSSNGYLTGISHVPGSDLIFFEVSGTYKIMFSVSAVELNQFALFINGIPVPGGLYGSGGGTQQNNGMLIVSINAGDIITLRNHSSNSSVTLQSLTGGNQTNVNASILIEQL